jgi:hypothetical protein
VRDQIVDFVRRWSEASEVGCLNQHYLDHYNTARLHSAIGFVTPADMLEGRQKEIHADRDRKT